MLDLSRPNQLFIAAGMGKPTRNEHLAEYYLRSAGVGAIWIDPEGSVGEWPVMTVAAARVEAKIIAGRIAGGTIKPSKRAAVTLEAAIADYVAHLEKQAAKRGKPARWAYVAQKIADKVILPKLGRWSLADLSNAPAVVRDWHIEITEEHGPCVRAGPN